MLNTYTRVTACIIAFLQFCWLWYYILFFDISKSTWWNVWCQNPYITETFTKLSWTSDKVEENDLNMMKNMYVLLMTHIIAFIQTTLTGCGSFCLQNRVKINWESFPRQERLCKFIFYIQPTLLVGYGA